MIVSRYLNIGCLQISNSKHSHIFNDKTSTALFSPVTSECLNVALTCNNVFVLSPELS